MLGVFFRFVIVWVLLLATGWVGYDIWRAESLTAKAPRPIAPRADLTDAEKSAIAVFAQVERSVPYLSLRWAEQDGHPSSGNAVAWDVTGNIVTSLSLVDNATEIGVLAGENQWQTAEVIGVDRDYGIAVIKLGRRPLFRINLTPITMGSSGDLRVGQTVFAVGSHIGPTRTLSQGIVGAVNRVAPGQLGREIGGVIQTDAVIDESTVGGPLLDSAGRIIGLVTSVGTGGVGFAVPIDMVNQIVPALIRGDPIQRPGIGIIAIGEGDAVPTQTLGVAVKEVQPGSPAERAGLQGIDPARGNVADIIIQVDERPVRTVAELVLELARVGVGNQASLRMYRNGSERTVRLMVADMVAEE